MTRPVEWPKSGWYWHLHHDRLFEWTDDIDERWDYVVANKPDKELETRLRLIALVRDVPERLQKAYAEWQKADAEWQKAGAERQKADAERQKAYAEWQKAGAEWQKADAEWQKADAEWQKAGAEWQKADAEWQKAGAERQKAYAERQKAGAERQKAYAECAQEIEAMHAAQCPGCPWDGKTIFPVA